MEINGRTYTHDDVTLRLRELDIAVSKLPSDAPLRPHFEFLLGVIDAYARGEYSDEDESQETSVEDKDHDYSVVEAVGI